MVQWKALKSKSKEMWMVQWEAVKNESEEMQTVKSAVKNCEKWKWRSAKCEWGSEKLRKAKVKKC